MTPPFLCNYLKSQWKNIAQIENPSKTCFYLCISCFNDQFASYIVVWSNNRKFLLNMYNQILATFDTSKIFGIKFSTKIVKFQCKCDFDFDL